MNEVLLDLIVCFCIKWGFFCREIVEVRLFEFDNFGCVMKIDKVFNFGDIVIIDLIMDMFFENIQVEGVFGLVIECRKYCSNFFYFIDFFEFIDVGNFFLVEKLCCICEVVNKKKFLKLWCFFGLVFGLQ